MAGCDCCWSAFLVFVVVICSLLTDVWMVDVERRHPAIGDFSRHALIKPRIYHGREKRQISSSRREEDDLHHDHLVISLSMDHGQEFLLDLTRNDQLIPKGYFRRTQHNGSHIVDKPTDQEIDHCHYSGKIRGKSNSWVALSTCHGLSGVVFDGDEMHYIERNHLDPSHVLYRHSDLKQHNKTCGYEGGNHNVIPANNHNRPRRFAEDIIRGPYNANKESKYVELVIVVDNREFKELGENVARVENHCKTIANIINGLYAPLNIFVALVGVVIWTDHDEISFNPNGDTTLTNFLHYRRENLIKEHPNDNAQLLSKFTFENGVVGKALKGPMCTYEYSGGVNTDHSPVIGLVATTVAHEMGHNFGMEHDTNECKCPEDRCIMAPSSSTVAPTHWSSCSLNYLLLAFTHGMDYCLKNKPEALFGSPVCGNGFVEPGEQCDCGLPEHCDNTCCDAVTCMLHSNASCATGECCDLETCRPKNAGTLCRSADYECDLPEYCTGQSEYCPNDIYKMDTEICDDGKAFCYHGFCRTRTDQCKLLWGETGKSSDNQCYKMNNKGTRHGNCGYNKLNQSFFKCNDENVLCGMLHCKHLNERLEFGMESVSILSHTFLNYKGEIIPCRSAIVDLGINQVDPGLAPDGAMCGDGKMCVNQKCMPVASLQRQGHTCPLDCNGNGWCNNLGHCHCKLGFAPPFCQDPGPGGSEDSGPATDPNASKEFVAALFVIFLGILPLGLILAFVAFYVRANGFRIGSMKKSSRTSSPKMALPSSKSPPKPPFCPDHKPEDNHSLLHDQEFNRNEFFGHFKNFTLSKATTKQNSPPDHAYKVPPPRPTPPQIVNQPVRRAPSVKMALAPSVKMAVAPALPPPNPGSCAKLIISSPILENSTCTAKELVSPLRNAPKVPTRPAPVPSKEVASEGVMGPSAINRIASFLRSKGTNSLPRTGNSKLIKNLDKSGLKSLEISGPIPLIGDTTTVIEVKVEPIARTQSMRDTKVTKRPAIQTFGSMRQPNNNRRPLSIPNCHRPTSPPPPAPKKVTEYDDCLNLATVKKTAPLAQLSEESTSPDNIYAVIEESPTQAQTPNPNDLLGEIVNEIQSRNFDSIYSTSTLARKKKAAEESQAKSPESDYVNTCDSIYSNMNGKSDGSTTSSGYVHPSAINLPVTSVTSVVPVKPALTETSTKPKPTSPVTKPVTQKPVLSTFKSEGYKTFSTRSPGPLASSVRCKTPESPKGRSNVINLKTRKPSPSRTAPGVPPLPQQEQKKSSLSNSPDVVTSCGTANKTTGKPDVVATKKPLTSAKPNLKTAGGPMKTGGKVVTKTPSNVASLQQKFEGKGLQKTGVKSK